MGAALRSPEFGGVAVAVMGLPLVSVGTFGWRVVPDGGGPGSPALSYGLRVSVRPAICLEAGAAAVPSIGRHGPLDRVPATIAASQPGRPEPGRGFVKPRSTLKLRLKCWGQRSPDERRSEPHGEVA